MKASTLAISLVLTAFFSQIAFGQGQSYTKSTQVPKLSSTPKSVFLKSLPSNASIVKVRASLAEDRQNSKSSRGGAGGTARLTMMRKFVRVEITGANVLNKPGSVEVGVRVKEDGKFFNLTQKVSVHGDSTSYVIDTKGFVDKFGADIKTKSNSTTITSTKYVYDESEVTGVSILVRDTKENPIYSGGWPEAPNIQVSVPDYLQPREFTSVSGSKLQALVVSLDDDVATLLVKGKSFEVPLETLIESDREYLKNSDRTDPETSAPAQNAPPGSTTSGVDWAAVAIGDRYRSKVAPNVSKRPFTISADIEITNFEGGVLAAQGGHVVGYTLYLSDDGNLVFGIRRNRSTYKRVKALIKSGVNSIVAAVDEGGELTLRINGKLAGSQPGIWMPRVPAEDLSIGFDYHSFVDKDTPKETFSGKLNSLIIQ